MNSIGLEQIIKLGSNSIKVDPKYLVCSICFCILIDPLECKNKKCKKVFCSSCIQTANNNTLNKVCPFCRVTDKLAFTNEDIYLFLKSLKIMCFQPNCSEQVCLNQYSAHFKTCEIQLQSLSEKNKKCSSCSTSILNYKQITSFKCVSCAQLFCSKCKELFSCFNCKSLHCKSCISTKLKEYIGNEYLCGMCDSDCQSCNKSEAMTLCELCNKMLCKSTKCVISISCEFELKMLSGKTEKTISVCADLKICIDAGIIESFKGKCFISKCKTCTKSLGSRPPNIKQLLTLKSECKECNKQCNICLSNTGITKCKLCLNQICNSQCSMKCKRCKSIVCRYNPKKTNQCFTNCIGCKQNYCSDCISCCSGCSDFRVCIECETDVLRECLKCKQSSGINGKRELLCLSCWNVCNYCNEIFCSKHTNTCTVCESSSCQDHVFICKFCNIDSKRVVCMKSCFFKCSFCNNEGGYFCSKTKNYNPNLKNLERKESGFKPKVISNIGLINSTSSSLKSHPYVYNLVCNHNVCEACIKYCAKCPSKDIKVSCPQCVSGYYYHFCRYCQEYQCNVCSRFCQSCEESYCNTCKCTVCNVISKECKNCFYINKIKRCVKCLIKIEVCNDCRKLLVCSANCYGNLFSKSVSQGKHLCSMFYCSDCYDAPKLTDQVTFRPDIAVTHKIFNSAQKSSKGPILPPIKETKLLTKTGTQSSKISTVRSVKITETKPTIQSQSQTPIKESQTSQGAKFSAFKTPKDKEKLKGKSKKSNCQIF